MLSEWFIDFSNSKQLIFFFNVKMKWMDWKINKILSARQFCHVFYYVHQGPSLFCVVSTQMLGSPNLPNSVKDMGKS